jgi:hypothetical protein
MQVKHVLYGEMEDIPPYTYQVEKQKNILCDRLHSSFGIYLPTASMSLDPVGRFWVITVSSTP